MGEAPAPGAKQHGGPSGFHGGWVPGWPRTPEGATGPLGLPIGGNQTLEPVSPKKSSVSYCPLGHVAA